MDILINTFNKLSKKNRCKLRNLISKETGKTTQAIRYWCSGYAKISNGDIRIIEEVIDNFMKNIDNFEIDKL